MHKKAKASSAKLGQTTFEIANKAFKGKDDFTFAKSKKNQNQIKSDIKEYKEKNTKVLKGMIDDAFKDKKENKKYLKHLKTLTKVAELV